MGATSGAGGGQSIQWPKRRRTINTMAKEKEDNQYNGQREEATRSKGKNHMLSNFYTLDEYVLITLH
jgi:hypothetical protein